MPKGCKMQFLKLTRSVLAPSTKRKNKLRAHIRGGGGLAIITTTTTTIIICMEGYSLQEAKHIKLEGSKAGGAYILIQLSPNSSASVR